MLVSAMPEQDGRSAIITVRETDGTGCSLTLRNGLTGNALKCIMTDVTGKTIANGTNMIKPFETRFFRVLF